MSSPSERLAAWVTRLTGGAAIAATTLLVVLPPMLEPARAGVTTEEARSAFDTVAPSAAASAPAPLRYQLRCWQRGRLVIEESGLELPAAGPATGGSTGSVRLRASDARKQALYLTETQNATCLLRPLPAGHPSGR